MAKLVALLSIMLVLGTAMIPNTALAAPKPGVPHLGPVASGHLHVTPDGYYCDPGWIYDSVSNQGRQIFQLGPTYGDYNGTGGTATVTLTATVGGTVSVGWSGGVSLDANVIVAGVRGSINGSVQVSLTAYVTNSISFGVPAYKTGYGQYGVWRQVAVGHYYYLMSNCTTGTDYGWPTTYSPWYVGWNTWIG